MNSKKVENFFEKIDNPFLKKIMNAIDQLTPEEKKVLLHKCCVKIRHNLSLKKRKIKGGNKFGHCPPPNEKVEKMDVDGTNCGAIIVNDARPAEIIGEKMDVSIPEAYASLVDDDDDDLIPVADYQVNSRYFARRMEFDDDVDDDESLILGVISNFFIVMRSFMQNLSEFERYPSGIVGLNALIMIISIANPMAIGLCFFIIMYITNFVRRGGKRQKTKKHQTKRHQTKHNKSKKQKKK
jgi:hypothetical protein